MEYTVIRSKRKTVTLQINSDAELIIRVPNHFSKNKIDKFIEEHRDWIEKKTAEAVKKKEARPKLTSEDIEYLKAKAEIYLNRLTERYAKLMQVEYGRVKITSAQKRFGSCSSENNICYSYILMMYPKEAIEYVVVHELAHTVHHNHGKEFYKLIEKYLPDYKQREKLLKDIPKMD